MQRAKKIEIVIDGVKAGHIYRIPTGPQTFTVELSMTSSIHSDDLENIAEAVRMAQKNQKKREKSC